MKHIGDGKRGLATSPWLVRPAASSLECVMAFTLLSSVLAFSTPLIVKHKRLVAGQRDYRLALDEVTNQLERLTTLPRAEVIPAVEQLKLSEFAAARLPGATLRGEVQSLDMGQRVTLTLSWEQQAFSPPVVLAAWLFPESAATVGVTERSRLP